MVDVGVTNDENVDGIIHNDEKINSFVVIDDAVRFEIDPCCPDSTSK